MYINDTHINTGLHSCKFVVMEISHGDNLFIRILTADEYIVTHGASDVSIKRICDEYGTIKQRVIVKLICGVPLNDQEKTNLSSFEPTEKSACRQLVDVTNLLIFHDKLKYRMMYPNLYNS